MTFVKRENCTVVKCFETVSLIVLDWCVCACHSWWPGYFRQVCAWPTITEVRSRCVHCRASCCVMFSPQHAAVCSNRERKCADTIGTVLVPGLASSNKTYRSSLIKKHSGTVLIWYCQNADGSLKNYSLCHFRQTFVPYIPDHVAYVYIFL